MSEPVQNPTPADRSRRRYACVVLMLAPLLLLAHALIGAWRGLRDGAAEIAEAWEIANGR